MTAIAEKLALCSMLFVFPCLMGAVTISITNPADGTGATWTINPTDGTTTGCANGSQVTGVYYKKSGMNWNVLGPFMATATNPANWTTIPDRTLGVPNKYTASGDYKVKATVMDNATFATDSDENFWTIP